ncbi:hypothetical protein EB796_015454 [Bugula neritina]|uniref:Uncharacterized protein n=1 Tax=Bugula neritina TaxID=10212 RepID=A0A7J7JLC0_BUGNE|nr:hypothetical protein EB796_015454 [Bugula neritina]
MTCLVNTIILVLLAVLPQSHAAVYVFRSETDSGFRAGTTDITATLYIAVTGGNVSPPWNVEPLFSKSVTILSVSGPAGSSATGSGGTITETALTVTGGQIYTYEVIYSFSGNTATTYDGVSLSSNFDHVKVPTVAQDGVLEAQDITATSITTTPTTTTTTTPTTTTHQLLQLRPRQLQLRPRQLQLLLQPHQLLQLQLLQPHQLQLLQPHQLLQLQPQQLLQLQPHLLQLLLQPHLLQLLLLQPHQLQQLLTQHCVFLLLPLGYTLSMMASLSLMPQEILWNIHAIQMLKCVMTWSILMK